MSNKAFRTVKMHRSTEAKLARDLKAVAQTDRIHSHAGFGCLPPSQMGWGQHKIDKARITLAPIWRKP
jgi:hypothetical protein